MSKHALLFKDLGGEYNIPKAADASSVREFDEGLTRVSFGFKSVDDYYLNSSSSISAANDPIAPSRGIPRDEIKSLFNFHLCSRSANCCECETRDVHYVAYKALLGPEVVRVKSAPFI
ncbi:hypothetical protein ACLOJK_018678 [Asimina triloba]